MYKNLNVENDEIFRKQKEMYRDIDATNLGMEKKYTKVIEINQITKSATSLTIYSSFQCPGLHISQEKCPSLKFIFQDEGNEGIYKMAIDQLNQLERQRCVSTKLQCIISTCRCITGGFNSKGLSV